MIWHMRVTSLKTSQTPKRYIILALRCLDIAVNGYVSHDEMLIQNSKRQPTEICNALSTSIVLLRAITIEKKELQPEL